MMMRLNKCHPLYQEDIERVLSLDGIDTLKNKSFLVTGATGLLGVFLIDVLMRIENVRIVTIGRSRKNAIQRLGEYFGKSNFEFIEHDVTEPLPTINVDYIIPAASNTHPLAYSQYPIETMLVNLKGAEYALNLAASTGATLLYMSSVEIYGNAYDDDIFTEDYTGQLNLETSRSCYTESKRACEALCQSFLAEKKVDVKIARLSRVFGPTMLENDTKASSQFIKNAVNHQDIILKSNGEQLFSYTYTTDAIMGLLTILLKGENGVAYNISNNKSDARLKDFAQICAEYTGRKVVFDIPSAEEAKGYSIATKAVLSSKRIDDLGYAPQYDLRSAIIRTITMLE